jgi:hypothetical protein
MRFLLLLVVVAVCVYALWFRAEPAPPPPLMKAEDTLMGGPLVPYNKAKKFQAEDYNEALDEHRDKMDERIDEDERR